MANAERMITRVHSQRERLNETLVSERNEVLALLSRVEAKGKGILQQNQIIAEFEALPEQTRKKLEGGPFFDLLKSTQVHYLH
jgi:sucrose synthase